MRRKQINTTPVGSTIPGISPVTRRQPTLTPVFIVLYSDRLFRYSGLGAMVGKNSHDHVTGSRLSARTRKLFTCTHTFLHMPISAFVWGNESVYIGVSFAMLRVDVLVGSSDNTLN